MKRIWVVVFLAVTVAGWAQRTDEITPDDLREMVGVLASDSLKGRKPGTQEADIAARYLLLQFEKAGLKPLCENGLQPFDVVTDVVLGAGNSLRFRDTSGVLKKTFIPLAFSSSGTVAAPVVFAGFGFTIDADSLQWNDYKGIECNGKWVLIFRADPEPDNPDSRFIPYSDIRSKVLNAKDHGAAGVLLVTPSGLDPDDKLMPLIVENNEVTAGIPVVHIKRGLADLILKNKGLTTDSLENRIIRNKTPEGFGTGVVLDATTDVTQMKARTSNVVALLEGTDPELKSEYIVVGAHYDHLGMGGPASGSRMPDTNAIHNGADDNASGTALIVEIARRLASNPVPVKRSILFIAFSGEETGLLGSKHFISHPPVSLSGVKAMFNFDMVGRFDKENNSISVSGTGTSVEADSILHSMETGLPFTVIHSPDGYGPSDHAAFYSSDIPVFYFTTGVHTDYHTPFDDPGKLDYEGEARLGDFATAVIWAVANYSRVLTFRESGNKDQAGRGGRRLKVTLGIMPDFAGSEKRGLRVDGVTKDAPADRGGMKKGDIITFINAMPVGNIYEYMSRLSKLKHGMTVNVEVIRNDQKQILLIQL